MVLILEIPSAQKSESVQEQEFREPTDMFCILIISLVLCRKKKMSYIWIFVDL